MASSILDIWQSKAFDKLDHVMIQFSYGSLRTSFVFSKERHSRTSEVEIWYFETARCICCKVQSRAYGQKAEAQLFLWLLWSFCQKTGLLTTKKIQTWALWAKLACVLTYFSKENIKSWKVNLKENCQPRAAATYLGKNPTPSANYPFPHPLPLIPLKAITLWCHLAYFLRKVWTLLPAMVTGITCASSAKTSTNKGPAESRLQNFINKLLI